MNLLSRRVDVVNRRKVDYFWSKRPTGSTQVVRTASARFREDTLDTALDELTRLRDIQTGRVSNMQNRAGVLTGASAVAAGLVSAAADSPWWILPIALFAIAAVIGTSVFFPSSGGAIQPNAVVELASGISPAQLKHAIATGIVTEYKEQEDANKRHAGWLRLGLVVLIFAIASISVLASVRGIPDVSPTPKATPTSTTES